MGYNQPNNMHELDPSRLPVPVNREGQIGRRAALQTSARATLVSLLRFPLTRVGMQAITGGIARMGATVEGVTGTAVGTQVQRAAVHTVAERAVTQDSTLQQSNTDTTLDNNALINQHIGEKPWSPGAGDARLKDFGVPVWALVGYSKIPGYTLEMVATDYDIPLEAVKAAMAYYDQNKQAIDNRIGQNNV